MINAVQQISYPKIIDDVIVPKGTAFGSVSLPSTVDVILNNSYEDTLSVSWSSTGYDGNTVGVYPILGTLSGRPNPGEVKAVVNVIVREDATLADVAYVYYDFEQLTGANNAAISNGNAGLVDQSGNGHTATVVNTPTIREITVDGNTIKSLKDTSNQCVNTGSPFVDAFSDPDGFEVWVLMDSSDGIPNSGFQYLMGNRDADEGVAVIVNSPDVSGGRLEVAYRTTAANFSWRTTNALMIENANPLTLLRVRVNFADGDISVFKNGQNSGSGVFQDMIDRQLLGSFVSGTMGAVDPTTFNCSDNVYVGARNVSGVADSNVNTTGIARFAITRLLTTYEAVQIGKQLLSNFSYLQAAFRFPSTIDSITNLYARCCFDRGTTRPLLVVMPGWEGDTTVLTDATYARFKDYGFFVLSVGMRGRHSASGSADASGRELHDIYDAINAVRLAYGDMITNDPPMIVGYSAGNVLGMLCKFPDLFKAGVDYFGVSDFGYDGTFGWYWQNVARQARIITEIGDDPADMPNEYRSRYIIPAIARNLKSYLYIFHDEDDTDVDVDQSTRVEDALDALGRTHYEISVTNSGSPSRWLHEYPNSSSDLIDSETTWEGDVHENLGLGPFGKLVVIGFVKTKLFTLWLGNGTSAQDGKNRVALLKYNFNHNRYVLTPVLNSPATSLDYYFEDVQGRIASGTISAETIFFPFFFSGDELVYEDGNLVEYDDDTPVEYE